MKKFKNLFLGVYLLCLFLIGTIPLHAEEERTGASNWSIRDLEFSHTQVSFELSGVEMAQEATAVITSEKEGDDFEVRIPFTIESEIQSFQLDLPEDSYLPAGKNYRLTLCDQNGGEGFAVEYLNKCNIWIHSMEAYPNQLEAVSGNFDHGLNATVEVGFQQYEGTFTNSKAVVPYPKQEKDTKVKARISDDYGCEEVYVKDVVHQYLNVPYIDMYADSVWMQWAQFRSGERMAVKIGEEVYYSEYDYKKNGWSTPVCYPKQPIGTEVEIWMESKNGSMSEIEKHSIKECIFKDTSSNFKAYPAQFTGELSANERGQMPTKATVLAGGKKYEASVQKNGSFIVKYPRQNDNSKVTLTLSDAHNCKVTYSASIKNDLAKYKTDDLIKQDGIGMTNVYGQAIATARLCAQIGGKTYYSPYAKYNDSSKQAIRVSYPAQKPGTKIKLWYEMENTSKTDVKDYVVQQRHLQFYVNKMTASHASVMFGYAFYQKNRLWHLTQIRIEKMYVVINGKKGAEVRINALSSLEEYKVDDDDYDDDDDEYYVYYDDDDDDYGLETYRINYSAKVDDKIQIVAVDENGYSYTLSKEVPNVPPDIKVDKIDANSKKVSGKTTPGASVTVKVGKKKYKVTAGKKGKFSVNIKSQKPGKSISISVKTKEGYYDSILVKVKKITGDIRLTKFVYRDSKSLSCKITNAKKGDKITVKIGGKTFTKKIKSKKKTQRVTIPIEAGAAGQKIKLTYLDKYKNKKGSFSSMVYLGNTIYVGMSSSDVVLTTWGKPIRRNSYGSMQQWIFKSGSTVLYVYIENGKVVSLQKFNY